mgnify:CR=1 FL=1
MFGSRKIKTRPYDCRQYHYGHLTRKEALEEYPESGISPTDIDGDSAFAVTWSGDALGLIAGYRENMGSGLTLSIHTPALLMMEHQYGCA